MTVLPAPVAAAFRLGGHLDLIERKNPEPSLPVRRPPKKNRLKKKVSFNPEEIGEALKDRASDIEDSLRIRQETNNILIAAMSKEMGVVIRGVVDSGAVDHVTNS